MLEGLIYPSSTRTMMLPSLRFPRTTIVCCLAFFALCGSFVPSLKVAVDGASLESMAGKGDLPVTNSGNSFDADETVIVIAVQKPQSSVRINSPDGLAHLIAIQDGLERTLGPYDTQITSLVSVAKTAARYLDPTGILVRIGGDLDRSVAQIILNQLWLLPFVKDVLIANTGREAAYYINIRNDHDRELVVEALQQSISRSYDNDFRFVITGPAMAEITLGKAIIADVIRLTPLIAVVLSCVLFLCTRSIKMVCIAFAAMSGTVVTVVASMVLLGIPVTLLTTIVPAIILGIGITDQINLMYRVRAGMSDDEKPIEMRAQVVAQGLRDVYVPLIASSSATALAFFSFIFAASNPLREFGIVMGIGTIAALLISLILTPALLVVFPLRYPKHLQKCVTERREIPRRVVIILALTTGGVLASGITKLHINDSWIDNFAPSSDIVKANQLLDDNFVGAYRLDVVINGPTEFFGTSHSDPLVRLVADAIAQAPGVARVISAADIEAFRSQFTGGTISREGKEFDQFVSATASQTRLFVFMRHADYQAISKVRAYITKEVQELMPKDTVISISGSLAKSHEVVRSLVNDELAAIPIAIIVLLCTVLLIFRSLAVVACVLVPVVGAVIATFGVMGHLSIPIGIASALFASITLGVGVDFGIYAAYAVKQRGADNLWNRCTGHAIGSSALFLMAGFAVLLTSEFRPNHNLGLLLASAAAGSYVFTLAGRSFLERR